MMKVTIVHVYVKPEHIDDFIRATFKNHNHSIKEIDNLRFDVLQDVEDPAKFVLYEAYENEAAAAVHKNTNHYLEWRKEVAPWMSKDREGIKYETPNPSNR
jgi:(4S)-4-hydroxy-5-phosphonooxypentane-2,3-dione isomerase